MSNITYVLGSQQPGNSDRRCDAIVTIHSCVIGDKHNLFLQKYNDHEANTEVEMILPLRINSCDKRQGQLCSM